MVVFADNTQEICAIEESPRKREASVLRILILEESVELVSDLRMEIRQNNLWEMVHAQSSMDALQKAGESTIDVALLSATMPGVDPIEVAEQLTQLYPKLITFILAPDAESGGGLAFASGRFQWLPKPCNPSALIMAIERMDNLVSWMKNSTTLSLVAGLHGLPTIPSNYHALLKTINSPDSSLQDVGEAVSKDLGITSRVLQVANSARYGYSKRITNPIEATNVLGMETLKSLVLYSHVLNNFPQNPELNGEFDRIWKHSMMVGGIARNIALIHTQDPARGEEAFTAGVLHDIGKLVLMSLKSDQ